MRYNIKKRPVKDNKGISKMKKKIAVIGLGHIGLQLAFHFSKAFGEVTGFDRNKERIAELKKGHDSMKDISKKAIGSASIRYTSDPKRLKGCNFIIIAVPTPLKDKEPDLSSLKDASEIAGKILAKGATVVYESTVYPGATEEICIPILEKHSGLGCPKDFKAGYSPERVNIGDKKHSLDKVIKVVSAIDKGSLEDISETYSKVIRAGIHKAKSIMVAEASKLAENIQRDVNIALANELSLAFSHMGIGAKEVIEASSTKWNFHRYSPGLVGGSCIAVDPYYLIAKAGKAGYKPGIIKESRKLNESMVGLMISKISQMLRRSGKGIHGSKVLLMGLSYKEDISDMRQSRSIDLVLGLKEKGALVFVHDPLVSEHHIKKELKAASTSLDSLEGLDCIIIAAPHSVFRSVSLEDLKKKMRTPILVDIKGFYDKSQAIKKGFSYYSLLQ